MPGRDPRQRHLRDHDGDAGPRGAEEGPPGLEKKREHERRERGRSVATHGDRVDASEPRDKREEAVPERKRVTGVKAAVLELPDVLQRERAEDLELAHPGEVEECVAIEDGHPPEGDPEADPGDEHRRLDPVDTARAGGRQGERQSSHSSRAQQRHRQPERAVHRERDRHRDEQGGNRPGEGRREPA